MVNVGQGFLGVTVAVPRRHSGKESACQCRRFRICWFDPWGLEDPLKEEVATPSSILAGKIPGTEEPGGL